VQAPCPSCPTRRSVHRDEVFRIARAPPVAGLALATAAGAFLRHLGVHPSWTLLSLPLLLRLNRPSLRPGFPRAPLVLALISGALLTHQWVLHRRGDCRNQLEDGSGLVVRGRLVGRVVEDRGELDVRQSEGAGGGCAAPMRFVLSGRAGWEGGDAGSPDAFPPGSELVLRGRWRKSRGAAGDDPIRAGYLRAEVLSLPPEPAPNPWLPRRLAGGIQARLGSLYPEEGGLVEALVLARKEGLSPETREAFARAGTAHLLAISGFHVGVVAGLLLLAGGWLGLSHPARFLLGSVGVWSYVLLIGLPDAAFRAALILTLLSAGRFRHRAVAPLGALASAFLVSLLADPGALLRPGFQLSFAGALGLMLWARPLGQRLASFRSVPVPAVVASGVAAGAAATLATLPLVGWHFGRISLVGIPVTLLAAPFVTLAIPGIFLTLLLSLLSPAAAAFLARGVELNLAVFARLVSWTGALPFASVWVSRPAVVSGLGGLLLGHLLVTLRPGLRGYGRRTILAMGAVSGLLVWPVVERAVGWGSVEMVVLDVGQGDALLLRSPKGRWILVDAGPRTESWDAGARTILPYLRSRGIDGLALVLLTHPDMDHVGGAAAVLREEAVGRVLDPGLTTGTEAFLGVLEGAREAGVPWNVVSRGDSLDLDGVAIRVLWPPGKGEGAGYRISGGGGRMRELLAEDGANAASVVLELRYGSFSALLTGDAPTSVEEAVLPGLISPAVQVLKVGHHGSRTSTSPELLERVAPEVALISVGARNRYGHPAPEILSRLEGGGTRIFRTDQEGTLVLRARRDGRYRVEGSR